MGQAPLMGQRICYELGLLSAHARAGKLGECEWGLGLRNLRYIAHRPHAEREPDEHRYLLVCRKRGSSEPQGTCAGHQVGHSSLVDRPYYLRDEPRLSEDF